MKRLNYCTLKFCYMAKHLLEEIVLIKIKIISILWNFHNLS
jgi:hypothetical protein